MKRNIICVVHCTMLFALCASVQAQQPNKIPRLGLLAPGSRTMYLPHLEAFRQGLRELGYVEGKNLVVDYRYPENDFDSLAADLVKLKVDIIVTGTTRGVNAVQRATSAIPVVMVTGDAVGNGFIESLSRPGGNITGLSFLSPEVRGKQFEILKEAFPKISRVAVFVDPAQYSDSSLVMGNDIEIARPVGFQAQIVEVRRPEEFEGAFKTVVEKRAGAILFRANPLFRLQQKRLLDLAAKSGLPAMYPWKEFVEAGGLMTYGPKLEDLYRRAATYVDKILKGAKPADLPVEQPKKFEFVVNLKTAKQIGVTIPPNVLARADKVIR